ncbi:hypothetical protein J7J90_01670 [Candidatus Micrarchaeota archaeon]|nr:hypothetical protein [Candidatus Micrarchaeota archaeon]
MYKRKIIKTGMPGLDELLGGGLEEKSITTILGGPGSGKTTFVLQYLYKGATKYNQPGMFISFEENKEDIYVHSLNYGWDFEKLEDENMFTLLTYKPYEIKKLFERGGSMLRDVVSSIDVKRIGIDSITSYAYLFENVYEARDGLVTMFDNFKKWGCTTMITSEKNPDEPRQFDIGLEYMVDGLIYLYYRRQKKGRVRAIEIVKMRGLEHKEDIFTFVIEPKKGIIVYPNKSMFFQV